MIDNKQKIAHLTVKEAIDQGYKYYTGYDYECQWPIKEALENHPDFSSFVWYLVDKEPSVLSISPSEIYEDLAENFAMSREVADDDDSFSDLIIAAIDWHDVANKINAKLAERPVYFPTRIKLIP